jgi:hypothetical protein
VSVIGQDVGWTWALHERVLFTRVSRFPFSPTFQQKTKFRSEILVVDSGVRGSDSAYVTGLYICSPAAALLSYTIEEAGVIATEENQSDGSSGGGGI